jgi:hypothetical protein
MKLQYFSMTQQADVWRTHIQNKFATERNETDYD